MRYPSPPLQGMGGAEVQQQMGVVLLQEGVAGQQPPQQGGGGGGGRVLAGAGRRVSERGVGGLAVDAGRLGMQAAGG